MLSSGSLESSSSSSMDDTLPRKEVEETFVNAYSRATSFPVVAIPVTHSSFIKGVYDHSKLYIRFTRYRAQPEWLTARFHCCDMQR